jgi:hypothetical protein
MVAAAERGREEERFEEGFGNGSWGLAVCLALVVSSDR